MLIMVPDNNNSILSIDILWNIITSAGKCVCITRTRHVRCTDLKYFSTKAVKTLHHRWPMCLSVSTNAHCFSSMTESTHFDKPHYLHSSTHHCKPCPTPYYTTNSPRLIYKALQDTTGSSVYKQNRLLLRYSCRLPNMIKYSNLFVQQLSYSRFIQHCHIEHEVCY